MTKLPFSPAEFVMQPRLQKALENPTLADIVQIPRAAQGEYEMPLKDIETIRRRLYDINKHNVAGFRFKTMREGNLLLVWRIR